VARDLEIDVLEIVLAGTPDDDPITGHGDSHYMRLSHGGNPGPLDALSQQIVMRDDSADRRMAAESAMTGDANCSGAASARAPRFDGPNWGTPGRRPTPSAWCE